MSFGFLPNVADQPEVALSDALQPHSEIIACRHLFANWN